MTLKSSYTKRSDVYRPVLIELSTKQMSIVTAFRIWREIRRSAINALVVCSK